MNKKTIYMYCCNFFLKLMPIATAQEPNAKKVSKIASHVTLSFKVNLTIIGIIIKIGPTKKLKAAKVSIRERSGLLLKI